MCTYKNLYTRNVRNETSKQQQQHESTLFVPMHFTLRPWQRNTIYLLSLEARAAAAQRAIKKID